MTVTINENKLHEDIWSCGYTMAQLFHNVADWAGRYAKHDVKIAMRDGAPIGQAAKFLNKKGVLDISNWSSVFLTRKAVDQHLFNSENLLVDQYFEQRGVIDKPFTLLDTGYRGTLPRLFDTHKGLKIQTLFMSGCENEFDFIPGEKRTFFRDAGISIMAKKIFRQQNSNTGFSKCMAGRCDIGLCEGVLERIPKKYKSFDGQSFLQKDGKILVVAQTGIEYDRGWYDSFSNGMQSGLEDSFEVVQNSSAKQWEKYSATMLQACPHIYDTFAIMRYVVAAKSKDYLEKNPLTGKIRETMPYVRDKIEQVYRER